MRHPGWFDRELRSGIESRHRRILDARPREQSRRHKICLYTREKRSIESAAHGISRDRRFAIHGPQPAIRSPVLGGPPGCRIPDYRPWAAGSDFTIV